MRQAQLAKLQPITERSNEHIDLPKRPKTAIEKF
jgi:hypothetical protein